MAKEKSGGDYTELYGSDKGTYSLTYRKNIEEIRAGNVPPKYTRMLPQVPGQKVLEIGAAEGVMSLSMAREKERVIGIEYTPLRHAAALELKQVWEERGIAIGQCEFILGDVFEHLDLLQEVDTVVADRVIYYFGDRVPALFAAIGASVPNVVLGGNGSRATSFKEKGDGRKLGEHARYSTLEGMQDLLKSVGYEIVASVDEYHPVVVGRKDL